MAERCRTAARLSVVLPLTLALAACGNTTPSPSIAEPSTTPTDLSAIACATDDPTDVGELTGAWSGSTGGMYYIRQVGDCVWWFGTEVDDIAPGLTGQPGYANVASGRFDGSIVVAEYADVPLGNVLGGGGLTFAYDDESGTLTLTDQRGGWQAFGDSVLTRIDPQRTFAPSPTESPAP